MKKLKSVYVIDTGCANLNELLAGAAALGELTTAVTCDAERAEGKADRILTVNGAETIVDFLPAVREIVIGEKPALVLLGTNKDARFAAAQLAAALGTSVFTDAASLEADGTKITATRLVYGGAAIKTESTEGCAVVCAGGGLFKQPLPEKTSERFGVEAVRPDGVRLTGREQRAVQMVDLGSAKRVVGIGRGVKDETTLAAAKQLAETLRAELACTRPIAEENKWLPRERYIGVSGATIKPALYLALGISGQVQHMAGVDQAGTIIAINKNKDAAIFGQCDIGIVGDVDEWIPRLTELMG